MLFSERMFLFAGWRSEGLALGVLGLGFLNFSIHAWSWQQQFSLFLSLPGFYHPEQSLKGNMTYQNLSESWFPYLRVRGLDGKSPSSWVHDTSSGLSYPDSSLYFFYVALLFPCRSNWGSVLLNHCNCQSIRASYFLKHPDPFSKLWCLDSDMCVLTRIAFLCSPSGGNTFSLQWLFVLCPFVSLQAAFHFFLWLFLTWLSESIAVSLFSSLGICPASTWGVPPPPPFDCQRIVRGFVAAIQS